MQTLQCLPHTVRRGNSAKLVCTILQEECLGEVMEVPDNTSYKNINKMQMTAEPFVSDYTYGFQRLAVSYSSLFLQEDSLLLMIIYFMINVSQSLQSLNQMGCGPSVKKAQDIPPANAKPSTPNFPQQPPSASNIKVSDFQELVNYDIRINEEQKNPMVLERMDFISKKHKSEC